MTNQRPTRKAGLSKPRLTLEQRNLQHTLDGIIERIEVLDGIRGDELDRAVTYRSLSDSGFDVSVPFSGGTPTVGGNPTTPTEGVPVPTPGPAAPPTNLTAAETFLAILLTWDSPTANLQHIEVHRSLTDNLSTAVLIGITTGELYVDYVGASQSYYYWIRALGTDGTVSAFNAVAGTLGTTGVDPSDFELELNISASNLVTALSDRIDLIDVGPSSILNRLTANEGELVSLDTRTDTLEADYTTLDGEVSANTTARTANATALTSLTTRVTTTESDITGLQTSVASNSQSILDLEATVGTIDASGGETWNFDSTVEGWTAGNATLTGPASGIVTFTPTAADPNLVSPTFSQPGNVYTQVIMRVRQTVAGSTWQGALFYTTSGHGTSTSFRKDITNPNLVLNEWTILTWDMSDLTAGGDDWVDNVITDLRFDLVSDSGSTFEIDYILTAKFSTSALSSAIDALDVRVSATETTNTSQGSAITALQSSVATSDSNITTNATAITSLQTDVSANTSSIGTNTSNISANATSITGIQSTITDGTSGNTALASAVSTLQTTVNDGSDGVVATATAVEQLLSRVNSGFPNVVNPLNVPGQNYNTTYTTSEIASGQIGGRSYVGGVVTTAGNSSEFIYKADSDNPAHAIFVPDDAIFEIQFSFYHSRAADFGSFYAGIYGRASETATGNSNVERVKNGILINTTNNPYSAIARFAAGRDEWFTVNYYVLGKNVNLSRCPIAKVNNSNVTPSGWDSFIDGFRLATNWFIPRFLNFNTSPAYGNDAATTLIVSDLSAKRVDSLVDQYVAIQTESTTRATDVGDLQALYTVQAELASGGQPYVAGFGLSADLINGQPSSAFTILADQFVVATPGFSTSPGNANNSQAPFIIGNVDGVSTVAIDGQLIVDGSIRGTSVVANTIGADKLNVNSLSAVSANLGTVTAGLLRTASSPSFRVEIEDQTATTYPIWYGSGAKGPTTGLFYADEVGNVNIRGKLDAGLIRASLFEASTTDSTFQIATEPAQYSGGAYNGKKAHFWPIRYANYQYQGTSPQGLTLNTTGYTSDTLQFYGPLNTSSNEYGRLGSYSETFLVFFSFNVLGGSNTAAQAVVQYRYDSGVWRSAFTSYTRVNDSTAPSHMEVFVSSSDPWSTLEFRLNIYRPAFVIGGQTGFGLWLRSASLVAMTPNFGYADLATAAATTGSTSNTGGIIVGSIPRQFLF